MLDAATESRDMALKLAVNLQQSYLLSFGPLTPALAPAQYRQLEITIVHPRLPFLLVRHRPGYRNAQ